MDIQKINSMNIFDWKKWRKFAIPTIAFAFGLILNINLDKKNRTNLTYLSRQEAEEACKASRPGMARIYMAKPPYIISRGDCIPAIESKHYYYSEVEYVMDNFFNNKKRCSIIANKINKDFDKLPLNSGILMQAPSCEEWGFLKFIYNDQYTKEFHLKNKIMIGIRDEFNDEDIILNYYKVTKKRFYF